MLKTKPDRLRALATLLMYFLPAWTVLVVAAFVTHPVVLVLLLAANSLAMAAVCHTLGFDLEGRFAHTALRRGAAHFLLLAGYAATVLLLLGWPMLWLLRDATLAATLALSTVTVVALLLPWRWWPAFGLVFVWDDAYPEDTRGSWLIVAVRRSLAFGNHLTAEHDLWFSHGLPVGLALLLVSQGALTLAGLCGLLPSEFRIAALALYGALLPLAHWLIANRTLHALLAARRTSRETSSALPTEEVVADGAPIKLPAGDLAPVQLDTALLRGARCGHVELALAALERGADPNAAPSLDERDQRSALVLAVLLPEIRLLRALIAKGADLNRMHSGLTPLLAATRDSHAGRPDAVLTLLSNGADPAIVGGDGNTPLHYAARAAEPAVAAMLLDAGALLTAVNRDRLTPLGCSAAAANWPLLRFLLERGAKPDVEGAQPALIAAAGIADDDVTGVRLLLKHKAKVDACGAFHRTALMAAALQGHVAITKALLDVGAAVDLADRHGTTALMEAARAGAAAVVVELAVRHADPNRVDVNERTALAIACQSRQATLDTVRALLALGADPQRATRDGRRPIDDAIAAGRWDIVATLDPVYPLPTNVAEIARGAPLPGADSPAHLLDALRFGHWNIAADFRMRLREWPEYENAELLGTLDGAEESSARAWLLAHGVCAEATLSDGRRVFDTWLDRLPDTLDACEQLFTAGVTPAGAGLPRRVLEAARAAPPTVAGALMAFAQRMLDAGGDAFASNAAGETCLHLAVQLGEVALTTRLLERGSDPNARDRYGRTPLHAALGSVQANALVRVLVRYGADPEAAATNGETCLGLAFTRHGTTLKHWLHWPRWPHPRRPLRAEDLPAAVIAGDGEALDSLIDLGLPLDVPDTNGASALLHACGIGKLSFVRRLLDAGADAEFVAPSGATCLSAAVSACREAVVDELLHRGVLVDRHLPGGSTALMIAAAFGHAEIASRLLDAGANPDLADEKGTTALHAAAHFAFQHHDTARAKTLFSLLIRHRAAPDPRNIKGQTPLLLLLGGCVDPGVSVHAAHVAALLPLLLDHGAALDIQDERGVGPLHACAVHGLLAPAQQLLARGAARDLRDCLGRSAGEIAQLFGYSELAQQLGTVAPIPSLAQMLRQPTRSVD